jgi:hypothetical protein
MSYRKAVLFLAVIPLVAMPADAQHERRGRPERHFQAELRGRNEVPLTLSAGRGSLELTVNEDDTSVRFVLDYRGLQTTVSAAHIHVGQSTANGGVTVFLCGGTTTPCPPQEGRVVGDFTMNDVLPIVPQQLEADNLAKLLRAIRAGKTYANVHTMTSPSGEIRGQIEPGKRKH